MTRLEIPKSCTGCSACVNVCPRHCIGMKKNSEGFLYPEIDISLCINCGKCNSVCPELHQPGKQPASFFMAWHKNKDVLMNSSSGGAFTAIADIILKKGGVVIGAAQSKNSIEIEHVAIDKHENIPELRLSKYYQSNMKDIVTLTKGYLKNKRYVLFVGTPCQIAGLLNYLKVEGGDITNEIEKYLLTVDFLCHGVTSSKVIGAYIKSKEKQYGKLIKKFQFRVKAGKVGWQTGGGYKNED